MGKSITESFKRNFRRIFLYWASYVPMPSKKIRPLILKLGGVNIKDWRNTHIGDKVMFDTIFPEKITIESDVVITNNCVILSHYFNPNSRTFSVGEIIIGNGSFIGCGTIICKGIKIGRGSVIGAGSILTHDVGNNELWAGNPARLIKTLESPSMRLVRN